MAVEFHRLDPVWCDSSARLQIIFRERNYMARMRTAAGGRRKTARRSNRPSIASKSAQPRRTSPQDMVAQAHRRGASIATSRGRRQLLKSVPRGGIAGATGRAVSGAVRSLTSRRSSSSSSRRTTGLKRYPGGNTPGGAIGRAHQSFFDIGNFLKGR